MRGAQNAQSWLAGRINWPKRGVAVYRKRRRRRPLRTRSSSRTRQAPTQKSIRGGPKTAVFHNPRAEYTALIVGGFTPLRKFRSLRREESGFVELPRGVGSGGLDHGLDEEPGGGNAGIANGFALEG
jgi:hypothetical protein